MPELPQRQRAEQRLKQEILRVFSAYAGAEKVDFEKLASDIEEAVAEELERTRRRAIITLLLIIMMDSASRMVRGLYEDARESARQQASTLGRSIAETSREWLSQARSREEYQDILARRVLSVDRAESIAITETTIAASGGEEIVEDEAKAQGIRLDVIWYTKEDERVCPICGSLHNTTESAWSRVGRPPAHPRCRCWLVYRQVPSIVSESVDSCGAGSPGGAGFKPGNTCAKNSGNESSESNEFPESVGYTIAPDQQRITQALDDSFIKANFSKMLEDWVHGLQGEHVSANKGELYAVLMNLNRGSEREGLEQELISRVRKQLDKYRDEQIDRRTKYLAETGDGESIRRKVLQDIEKDYLNRQEWFDYILSDDSESKEKQAANFEKSAKKFIDEAKVAIRVPLEIVPDVVADKRFKSQFESGDSEGFYGPDVRVKVENLSMGVPPETEASRRPIYGHVSKEGHSFHNGRLENYGLVDFVLKDEVKDRTSVTFGDSLDGQLPASRAKSPKAYSRINRKMPPVLIDVSTHSWPYVEAQVHGQVNIEDVEKVVISSGFLNPQHYDRGQLKKMLTSLKKLNGAPIEVESYFRKVSIPFRDYIKDASLFYPQFMKNDAKMSQGEIDEALEIYADAIAVADEVGIK